MISSNFTNLQYRLFVSAIVLSVLLRYTDSDCPFGILKLSLDSTILDYHWKKKWIDFLFAPFCILFMKIEHIVRYIHTMIIYAYDKLPTNISSRFTIIESVHQTI